MMESNISKKLTLNAKKCLKEAADLALYQKSKEINPEHLLCAIFLEEGCLGNTILKNIGINKESLGKMIFSGRPKNESEEFFSKKIPPEISIDLRNIITKAYSLASNFHYPYVGTEHFVYSILESQNKEILEIIQKTKMKPNKKINNLLESSLGNDTFANLSKMFDLPDIAISKKSSAKSKNTPYLDQFCVNLNEDTVKREEIIIGREKEVNRMINILGRKNKNNPVLIGEPGVGKTALVSKLSQRINSGEVPDHLSGKKILILDIALVVAGTSFRGEFEARLKEIVREASENKEVILFIDEIHSIVGAGNVSGGLDAANILKPALSRGDIQCIGATTISEYKKHFEKDPALERRFQPLKINEPSVEETKKIINGIKESYEKFHGVTISPEAIDQAIALSVRYINNRFLPDKSIDLIDETASALRNKGKVFNVVKKIRKLEQQRHFAIKQKNSLVNQENYDEALFLRQKEKDLSKKISALKEKQKQREQKDSVNIESKHISETVSQITGIPLEKITIQKSRIRIKNLEKNLESKIVGQKEALEKIAKILIRSSSGISNPERPMGSFLFLGPTGVGKTLTAKILAKDFFGSENNLIRIDMSEFMEKHNVSRLIGAPAGYVGYEEGGKLTEKIRHQPYSVVLFDEMEKAHPDVFNILLQILEDGILTDAEGKEISFRNSVIILTSNLGTAEFTDSASIGFKSKNKKNNPKFEETKTKVLDELKKEIKPEIINRLDHIIVFNPLGENEIKKIAKLELEKFKKRLSLQGIRLSYPKNLVDTVAKKSLSLDQGARLIRRNVQELVENEVASAIIEEKIKDNSIKLTVKKNRITVD